MMIKTCLIGLLASLVVFPSVAFAQTPGVIVVSPNGGECWKGGSMNQITWQNTGADPDHIALSYRPDGSQPLPWLAAQSSYFAHPVAPNASPYDWTVPTETVSTAKIWIDNHAIGDVSLGQDGSDGAFSIDSSPPTAPNLSSTGGTSSSISLSWSAAVDAGCKGLEGYRVYRNGSLVVTLGSGALGYTDAGLSSGTTYTYKVQAFDDFHITDSNSLGVTAGSGSSSGTPGTPGTPGASTPGTPGAPGSSSSRRSGLADPTLTKVTIDGQEIDLSLPTPVKVAIGQTVHFEGTAGAALTVVMTLTVERAIYETVSDSQGRWTFDLDTTNLPEGDQRVLAAVKNADGTTTTDKEIFRFTLVPAAQAAEAAASQRDLSSSSWANWLYPAAFVAALLITAVIVILSRRGKISLPSIEIKKAKE